MRGGQAVAICVYPLPSGRGSEAPIRAPSVSEGASGRRIRHCDGFCDTLVSSPTAPWTDRAEEKHTLAVLTMCFR